MHRRDAYPIFPSRQLDRVFREIAWKATIGNPLTGITDRDNDGHADEKPVTRK